MPAKSCYSKRTAQKDAEALYEKKQSKLSYNSERQDSQLTITKLYDQRVDIASGNQKRHDNTSDPVWEFLWSMVEELGPGGMSSDETDADANPSEGRKFWIKKCPWRSSALINYLTIVDKDQNSTTAYGGKRAGNLPRIRRRRAGGTASISIRPAVPGLPINFYDESWYRGLSEHDKKCLGAKEAWELPDITMVD